MGLLLTWPQMVHKEQQHESPEKEWRVLLFWQTSKLRDRFRTAGQVPHGTRGRTDGDQLDADGAEAGKDRGFGSFWGRTRGRKTAGEFVAAQFLPRLRDFPSFSAISFDKISDAYFRFSFYNFFINFATSPRWFGLLRLASFSYDCPIIFTFFFITFKFDISLTAFKKIFRVKVAFFIKSVLWLFLCVNIRSDS